MEHQLGSTINALEQAKKYKNPNIEYWKGRDLQKILAYTYWENFNKVIERAKKACESIGMNPDNHFRAFTKLVEAGSGTMVERHDYFLTRYACYLIAMNGDTNKPEVATAQTYFAVQTRRQELQDQLTDEQRRLYLRQRVKNGIKQLLGVAKSVGVKKFPIFQDAGYRGLYNMNLANILSRKGLSSKDKLFDRAGRTELAANEFRITQTHDKILRERIKGEKNATDAHYSVGRAVRDTIKELGGTMPEDLQPEPPIKILESGESKQRKRIPKK